MVPAPSSTFVQARPLLMMSGLLGLLTVAQFWLWPYVAQEAVAVQSVRTQQDQLQQLRQRIVELKASPADGEIVEQALQALVPPRKELPRLITQLESEGDRRRVHVVIQSITEETAEAVEAISLGPPQLTPDTILPASDTALSPLSAPVPPTIAQAQPHITEVVITATGLVADLLTYLEAIEHWSEVTEISQWNLDVLTEQDQPELPASATVNSATTFTMTLRVHFYFQPEPGSNPAASPAPPAPAIAPEV